jgi:hypothetical protein
MSSPMHAVPGKYRAPEEDSIEYNVRRAVSGAAQEFQDAGHDTWSRIFHRRQPGEARHADLLR